MKNIRNAIKYKKLKIIPFYTGIRRIEQAVADERSKSLLWLEIIFNGEIDWKNINYPVVKEAYKKACIWYWNFKTLIGNYINRKPLEFTKGQPDFREYRKFLEVLNFVQT